VFVCVWWQVTLCDAIWKVTFPVVLRWVSYLTFSVQSCNSRDSDKAELFCHLLLTLDVISISCVADDVCSIYCWCCRICLCLWMKWSETTRWFTRSTWFRRGTPFCRYFCRYLASLVSVTAAYAVDSDTHAPLCNLGLVHAAVVASVKKLLHQLCWKSQLSEQHAKLTGVLF